MPQPPQLRRGLSLEELARLLHMMQSDPAQHVANVLRFHGPQGTSFKLAWASAMRSLPRGSTDEERAETASWREALNFQRVGWQKRYELLWPATRESTLADAVRGRMAA